LVVLGSAGIFALFKGAKEKERLYDPRAGITMVFLFLGSHTFGIYLFHLLVIDVMDHYLSFNVASYPAIISVPVSSMLVFAIALALAVIIKKVPKVGMIVS
jgi:surface polysaccharide O-acyltransferase-like enzyme